MRHKGSAGRLVFQRIVCTDYFQFDYFQFHLLERAAHSVDYEYVFSLYFDYL